MRQVIDNTVLQTIGLFTKITHANLKETSTFNDALLFIVDEGELGKALGAKRANLVKLEKLLNRKVKIVEFSSELTQFIVNLVAPLRVAAISEEDGLVTISGADHKTRGLMIGASARNLRRYEEIARKYFPALKEIKVK